MRKSSIWLVVFSVIAAPGVLARAADATPQRPAEASPVVATGQDARPAPPVVVGTTVYPATPQSTGAGRAGSDQASSADRPRVATARGAAGSSAFSQAVTPDLRGFSLTLVLGDMKGGGVSDAVPAAAARALADMKDFLPYKSYTLLDTAWTIGSGTIKTQLRQSDTQVFDIELRTSGGANVLTYARPREGTGSTGVSNVGITIAGGGTVNVSNFRMRRAGAGGADRERQDVESALHATEQTLQMLRQQYADAARASTESARQSAANLQQRIAQVTEEQNRLRAASDSMAAKDAIIDTSFRMKVGETVVVGTSRQQGDRALIVIVTAVGK